MTHKFEIVRISNGFIMSRIDDGIPNTPTFYKLEELNFFREIGLVTAVHYNDFVIGGKIIVTMEYDFSQMK